MAVAKCGFESRPDHEDGPRLHLEGVRVSGTRGSFSHPNDSMTDDKRNVEDTQYLTPRQAVANGLDLLVKRGPANWRDRLDVDALYVKSPDRCVLGQLFDYYDSLEAVNFILLDRDRDTPSSCGYDGCTCATINDFLETAATYGFVVNSLVFDVDRGYEFIYAELQREWKSALAEYDVKHQRKRSILARIIKR